MRRRRVDFLVMCLRLDPIIGKGEGDTALPKRDVMFSLPVSSPEAGAHSGLFGPLMIFTTEALMNPDLARVCPKPQCIFYHHRPVCPKPLKF
jgi:hypothetical protein